MHKKTITSASSLPSFNPLLQRSQVGKCKQYGYSFDSSATFGRPNALPLFCANDCLNSWDFGHPSIPAGTTSLRSFLAVNRKAVAAGAVTAKTVREFRNRAARKGADQPQEQRPILDHGNGRSPTASHKHVPARAGSFSSVAAPSARPGQTFGVSNRPSTPMKDVVEHRYVYGRDEADVTAANSQPRFGVKASLRRGTRGMTTTRAARLRSQLVQRRLGSSPSAAADDGGRDSTRTDASSLFKLSRFKNVPARVALPNSR